MWSAKCFLIHTSYHWGLFWVQNITICDADVDLCKHGPRQRSMVYLKCFKRGNAARLPNDFSFFSDGNEHTVELDL